ncbi:MAG TPA: dTMP kinase, partial [Methanoregulaceae archaeon]|nr:dTMP kinase [Methanoregulaceae archaeon]
LHQLVDLEPVFTREPTSGWTGRAVRRGIAEEVDPVAEALLFAADHAVHLASVVRPALAEGRPVISDRYSDSRYAYQSVVLEGHLDDPLAWLRNLHAGWTIPPDQTYLLLLPVDQAVRRLGGKHRRREHFEQAEVLRRVQEAYIALAEAEPWRFVLVDATKEKREIARFVEAGIRRTVERSRARRRP